MERYSKKILNDKGETIGYSIEEHPIDAIDRIGKIEDIMDKYKVKDLEELELMVEAYIDERGEW